MIIIKAPQILEQLCQNLFKKGKSRVFCRSISHSQGSYAQLYPWGLVFQLVFELSLQQVVSLNLVTTQGSSMFDDKYFFNEYAWGSRSRDKQDIVYLEHCAICIARIPKVLQIFVQL